MDAYPDEEIYRNAEDSKALGNKAVNTKDYLEAAEHYRNALVGL
jgi:hypothetical protein